MYRVLRGLQLNSRAILLEGSPGVGKTSLVTALARCTGHKLVRINLSEATEASDLFGCDLPDENATEAGRFAWRDGPLLSALKAGNWVLLDEMNLAPQPVLECLNACLDHRGSVYIPELNRQFQINSDETRIFACQNPLREGGGRKALPKSFLNRFTQVHLTCMAPTDYQLVLDNIFKDQIPPPVLDAMLRFHHELVAMLKDPTSDFAFLGGPWEFNLRDLLRWAELLINSTENSCNPALFVNLIYSARLRSMKDREAVHRIWSSVSDFPFYEPLGRVIRQGSSFRLGTTALPQNLVSDSDFLILPHLRSSLEQLVKCIEMGWMAILVGAVGVGKRSMASTAAQLFGAQLQSMALAPGIDTCDLLGAFEQHEQGGVFRWVDSPLLTAIREGHWILLEHAELCSPSVLDRLNPLLEPDGELVVTERGLDAQGRPFAISPHPNFRLILAVNEGVSSVNGGLSRAMRNRGIEIFLLPNESSVVVPSPQFENDITLLRSIGLSFHDAATLSHLHSNLLLPQLLDSSLELHLKEFLKRHLRPLPSRSLLAAGHEFRQLTMGAKRIFEVDAWEQVVQHFFINRQTQNFCVEFINSHLEQVFAQCKDFACEVEFRTRPTTALQLQQLEERAIFLQEVSRDVMNVDLLLDPYWNPCVEGPDALQVAFRTRVEQLTNLVSQMCGEFHNEGTVASTVSEYSEMPVLQASVLAQGSDCPVVVREAFPQLLLYSKPLNFNWPLTQARDLVHQFSRLAFWIKEFLQAPLGCPQEWSDRHRFFSNFVGISIENKSPQESLRESLDRPKPRLVEPASGWQLHEICSSFHQEFIDLTSFSGEHQLLSQDFHEVENQEFTLVPMLLLKNFNSIKSSAEAWFVLLCVLARRPVWRAFASEALSYERLAEFLQQKDRKSCLFDHKSLIYFDAEITAKPCLWNISFSVNQMLFDYAAPHLYAEGCSLSKWKTNQIKLINLVRSLLTFSEPPRLQILPEPSVFQETEQSLKHKIEMAHENEKMSQEFVQLLSQLIAVNSLSKKWLVLGLLQIYSARITIPLDPYHVKIIHKRSLDQENELVSKEIEAFVHISRAYFGCSYDLSLPDVEQELRASVAERLEHPWHLGLVQRRNAISTELVNWQELNAQVVQARCQSNQDFASIRDRIGSFVKAYGHEFLDSFLQWNGAACMKLMDVSTRWCNAAADLLNWLLSSTRYNLYADIIHPFVIGLNMVLQALTQISVDERSQNNNLCQVQQLVMIATDYLDVARSDLELAYRLSSPEAVACLSVLLDKCRSRSRRRRDEETETEQFSREHWRSTLNLLDFSYNMLVTGLLQVDQSEHKRRLLALVVIRVSAKWRAQENLRREQEAERAALFIDAEKRKNSLRMQLQASLSGSKKSQKRASDLPELVDPELELELEWKMRFPEHGILSAQRELSHDDQNTGVSLVLGRDDQINRTVSKLSEIDVYVRSRLEEMQNRDISLIFYSEKQLNMFLCRLIYLIEGKRVCSNQEKQAELYAFAAKILEVQETPVLLQSTYDSHLGQHLSALSSFLQRMDQSVSEKTLNVYNDPIPLNQANKALDVMKMVRERTNELLGEWPDHPTLKHVLLLLHRMGQFPLSSPLMKFVSGFEMLLTQIQEWEKNAASHVSMSEELITVCNLLTEWRKLELKCWLCSLDAALEKAASKALPFWFHVHDLFLSPSDSQNDEDSAKSIVQLMENGPVAEFKQRLSILRSICLALRSWPEITDRKRERRLKLLTNLTWFYGQFETSVDQFLTNERRPIEREMRNFVRVMRWGSYQSFWSVKVNVDKCKKAMHKGAKAWESILRQSVKPVFEKAIPLQPCFANLSDEPPVFSLIFKSHLGTKMQCSSKIMKLINRLDGHCRSLGESDKPWMKCISSLNLLHLEWLQTVKRVSGQTKELSRTSPKAHILKHLSAPKETEVLDAEEQEIAKAKEWRQQYTALQQQKRLLLASWIKLSEKAKVVSQEKEIFEHLGLSSAKGQRLSSFADSSHRMQFLSQLPATSAAILSEDCSDFSQELKQQTLEVMLSSANEDIAQPISSTKSDTYEALHAFRQLLALRSCVPNCPEEAEMIKELGGPSIVSKLIGLLDDFVHQSAESWLNLLGSVQSKSDQFEKQTVAPLKFTQQPSSLEKVRFFPSKIVNKLRAQRTIIADTAYQLKQDLANFWRAIQIATEKLNYSELQSNLVTDYSSVLQQAGILGALVPDNRLPDIFLSTESVDQSCAKLRPKMEQLLTSLCASLDANLSIYLIEDLNAQHSEMELSLAELNAIFNELQTIFGHTIVPNFSSPLQRIGQALNSINALLSGDLAKCKENVKFSENMDTIVTRILSLAEKLIFLDKEAKCDDLLTAISNYSERWMSQILAQISSLERAVNRLKRSVSSSEQLHDVIGLGLLLEGVLDLLKMRQVQLWRLFGEWCRIGISFSQIMAQLFTEGFCKVKGATEGTSSGSGTGGQSSTTGEDGNEGEDDGCTSLSHEMSGNEAAGAKDVSDQIECKEQIEGLAQSKSDEKHDADAPPQAEDQGIEMPDDFDGQNEEGTLGTEEEDEKPQELDDERMADEDEENQENEGLNSEMWASENEEEDPGKDKAAAEDEAKHGGVDDKRQNKQRPEEESKGEIQETGQDQVDENEEADNKDECQDAKGSEKPAAQQKRKDHPGEMVPKEEQEPESDDSLDEQEEMQMEQELADQAKQQMEEMEIDQEIGPEDQAAAEQDDKLEEALERAMELGEEEPVSEGEEANGAEEEELPSDLSETEAPDQQEGKEDKNNPQNAEEMPREDMNPYKPGAGDLNQDMAYNAENTDAMDFDTQMDVTDQPPQQQSHSTSQAPVLMACPAGAQSGDQEQQFAPTDETTPAAETNSEEKATEEKQERGQKPQKRPKPASDARSLEKSAKLPKTQENSDILEADVSEKQPPTSNDENADAFQHVLDENENSQLPIRQDAATDEQLRQQDKQASRHEGDEQDTEELQEPDVPVPEYKQEFPSQQKQESKIREEVLKRDRQSMMSGQSEELPNPKDEFDETRLESALQTQIAQRAPDTSIHTQFSVLKGIREDSIERNLAMRELMSQLQDQDQPTMDHLGGENLRHMSLESAKEEWTACQNNSNRLAKQLCESLRLVLEPTRAAKMKGDYRTGKRLNLRKIIPYIASNFRKDKIWLRRSQPSQREYKIIIAIDDSSSMADNLCRQMTFEALNTVLTAFSLLEVGQVGICSFGESVKMLHPLDQPWTDSLGPELIRQFTFEQRHTSLVELITNSIKLMQKTSSTGNNQQLLLILSDGLFTESPDSPRVKAAVRMARDCNLFPVCIIFDDVRKQHSIFDMKRYSGPGKLQPYMDLFPLPYYMVMRQVTAMPHMLADALRQWFELAASM